VTVPNRVVAIGQTAIELIDSLGLGACVINTQEHDGATTLPTHGCPLSSCVPGHPSSPGYEAWAKYFEGSRTDAVVADLDCTTCLEGASSKVWPGQPVAFAIGRPPLAECLDLLTQIGQVFGVEERASTVFKQRSARLLAMRMHVARCVVRTPGVTLPVTLALRHDGGVWLVCDDDRTYELINAGGGIPAPLTKGSAVSLADITGARADVILAGCTRGGTADPTTASMVDAIRDLAPVVWHTDWQVLLRSSGPSIVDAVECVLRAVFPRALGANGTPPPAAVMRRVTRPEIRGS
jgi:hypothetical protein